MKSFLLACAAVIALLAAPLAAAQYAEPAPAPTYGVAQAAPAMTPAMTDPAVSPATPQVEPAPPRAYNTPNLAEAQPGPAQPGPAQPGEAQPGEATPLDAETADMGDANTLAEADAPATQVAREGAPEADISLAAMQEHARDAGMESLPMAPAQVCAPRSVDFEQSRLDREARRQLMAAVDRASVCEMRSVTIRAPESRANAVRQTLIAQGVDESKITVEAAAVGELEVEMAFNGVAASTPEFAALFNSDLQLAALDATDAAASGGAYAPTAFDPAALDSANKGETKPDTYEL